MKADLPTVILILITIMFVAGSLLAYSANPNSFSAEATSDGKMITIELHSSTESDYIVCTADLTNGEGRTIYVYYDDQYESATGSNEKSSIEKLEKQFDYVNVHYKEINATELKTLMEDTMDADRNAVVMLSGAIPNTVYAYSNGTTTNATVKDWMEAGGLVYWFSEYRFGYYSSPLCTEFVDWETDQPLEDNVFGLKFNDDITYGTERSQISSLLGLTQNVTEDYAVIGTPGVINLGYESEDGKYSIALAEFGKGGALILGGGWSANMTLAKIVASEVCDWETMTPIDYESGKFKGDKTVTFETDAKVVYVYYGTITPRYGELFIL